MNVDDVLNLACDPGILTLMDECVRAHCASGDFVLGALLGPQIADRLVENGWRRAQEFCATRFNEDFISPLCLAECLLRLFRPDHVGAWIGQDEVRRREPVLSFDDDGLLFGPPTRLEFRKEGVLTREHYLHYVKPVRPGVSGGFIDDLLRSRDEMDFSYFAVAINNDLVLARAYHVDMFTRLFIRGPIGIDLERLQDPAFPSNPSGVVTEHKRVGANLLWTLFPLERLEVMWSQRDGLKSVQFEELVAIDNSRSASVTVVNNRYVHSQWDPNQQCFVHFDGAIRSYHREKYDERLATDLKKYAGKAASYRKVFRIDGRIPLATWCRLVAKFYEENELVMEYLGGEDPTELV